MKEIHLIEKVNKDKLNNVRRCKSLPNSDETEIVWLEKIKTVLMKYTGKITYKQKSDTGRFYGNGLQMFPRDVRKYLSDNNYIDIDIENCHPVLLYNLMKNNNIKIPKFLNEYITDRARVLKENNLDKFYIIKFINNEICSDKNPEMIEFHTCLYKELLSVLKIKYPDIKTTKKTNVSGSLMAYYLQVIENEILMCMFNRCKQLKVKVGVLVFDGMMIEKETYYKELLKDLEGIIEKKLNYKVKLIEKSMETEWVPEIENKDELLLKELDIISSNSSVNIYDIKHIEIFNKTNKLIEAFMNATGIEPIHNMVSPKCKMIKLYADCSKNGYKIKCSNCEFVYPPENIAISKDISPNIYNLILINQDDIKNKQTEDVAKFMLNHTKILYNNKNWYIFNEASGIYEKSDDLEIQMHFCDIIEDRRDNNEKEEWFIWLKNIAYKKSLLEEMKVQCFSKEPLDDNEFLLGFKNGVYDLNTSTFRRGTYTDYITMKCGVEYSDEYDQTLAWSILNDMFPDKEELEFMICKLALCLEGYNREQKMTFNYGYTASNGKSFLMELMKGTLGDYGDLFPVTVVTGKMKQAGDTNSTLLAFKNKRFLYCSEPEAGCNINSNYIKTLTGDIIKVRGLYSMVDEEIKPTYRMFVCCNALPNFDTYDEGIARRISLLEFKTKFCLEPKKKTEKLLKKYSKTELDNIYKGLLVILLNKYKLLRENDFKYTEPVYLKNLCKLYLNDNKSVIKDILLENLEVGTCEDFVKIKDIKSILKNNGIKIDKDIITLKYLVEDTFEGVQFLSSKTIDYVKYYSLFINLKIN